MKRVRNILGKGDRTRARGNRRRRVDFEPLEPKLAPATLAIGNATVLEGNAGTFSVALTVTLSNPQGNKSVTVNYATADGTATAGTDYRALSGTVTFAPGETSKTVTVAVLGDGLDEPDETFTVKLSSLFNATFARSQAVGTIVDDDPPPAVSLSLTGTSLPEAGGTATVTATLSASSGRDVVVTLDFSGTATADVDYGRSAVVLTIPAESLSASLTLSAIDDTAPEGDETIIVTIAGVTNALPSGQQQVTAVITDDDPA